LAGNLNAAYQNMLRMQAQGISSLRESEIRLQNAGNPVATAGAIASEQFDSEFNYDAIPSIAAGEAINQQREEFIANATATEQNRQALIEFQRAQSELASSSGGVTSAIAEQQTELQKLAEEYQTLNEPFSQAQSAFDAVQTAMENGVLNNDQFVQSLERIQAAFLATGGTAEQWQNIVNKSTDDVSSQMKDLAENTLSNLGDEFINLAVEGKASFGDLAKSIIKALLRIAFQALVVKPLLDFLGFSGGGSFGGGDELPNATGNAFGNSGVTPFANGGSFTNSIVNTATPFTFAKGAALGVMGEAGPEAIMPLERGANGSLGVQMFGGAAKSANVNNSVNVENTYKIEGAVSEEKVLANIRAQGENTKEDVRKSMVGWLTDYEQNGTM